MAQAAAGSVDDAFRTVDRLKPSKASDDDRHYYETLVAIARAQALANDYEGALATAERISRVPHPHPSVHSPSFYPTYFGMLAIHHIGTVQADAGDIVGAESASDRIRRIWESSDDFGGFLGESKEEISERILGQLRHSHFARLSEIRSLRKGA